MVTTGPPGREITRYLVPSSRPHSASADNTEPLRRCAKGTQGYVRRMKSTSKILICIVLDYSRIRIACDYSTSTAGVFAKHMSQ